MTKYQHIRNVGEFFGVDLRSNDLQRPRGFASDGTQNVWHWPQGSVGPRPGTKSRQRDQALTSAKYEATDILGARKSEIVMVGHDGVVYVWRKSTFTITNSHASDAATVNLYWDDVVSLFRLTISRGGSTILSQTLGNGSGTGELSLASLETAIDGVSNLAMSTASAAGSSDYASYLDNIENEVIAANGGTITLDYWTKSTVIKSAASTTVLDLRNVAYEVGEESFEGVPTALVRGCLYLSPVTRRAKALTGGTTSADVALLKYDSQALYRAGMPKAWPNSSFVSMTAQTPGATVFTDQKGAKTRTGIDDGTHFYKATFKQVDKLGNVVEGNVSEPVVDSTSGTQIMTIGYISGATPQYLLSQKGYNTRFAVTSAAAGPALTFAVDNGAAGAHTLQVGDIGYLWDENQDRFIQREVTARSNSSITFSSVSLDTDPNSYNYDAGGNITVNDNAAISANLRICLWRGLTNSNRDSAYYLAEEIPYCEFHTYYHDTRPDSELGAEFVEAAYSRDEPPVGRYMSAFNDQLIVSGIEGSPTVVAYSDIDSPEYFATGLSEFEVTEPTVGVRQTGGVLAVGTQNGIQVVSGDLANFNFRVEKVVGSIGAVSHQAMVEIDEGVLLVVTKRGPYTLQNGRDFQPLGGKQYPDGSRVSRIEPYFTARYQSSLERPIFKRAIACVVPDDHIVIVHVPHELPATRGFATTGSTSWVFDYGRGAWWPWTGLNMAAGILSNEDGVFFMGRSSSGGASYTATATTGLGKFQRRAGKYNYADQGSAFTTRFASWWEGLGKEEFLKRFLRIRIDSNEDRPAASSAMALRTNVDFDDDLVSTTDTLTWASQKSLKVKIKGETCRSMQFVLEQTDKYQPIPITALEIEAVAGFREVLKE